MSFFTLLSGGSAPSGRSKYILDPSVQSGPTYGQSGGMYASPTTQTFNQFQPQPFASAGTAPFTLAGSPFVPNAAIFNAAPPFQQHDPTAGSSVVSASILSPAEQGNLIPDIPPIELAQSALTQQMQRNPTPPPGWNDPPPLTKSARQVSSILSSRVLIILCIQFDTNHTRSLNFCSQNYSSSYYSN